jgi:hypothetical protein
MHQATRKTKKMSNMNSTQKRGMNPVARDKYRQKTTTYKYRHHSTNTDKKQPPTNTVITLQIQTKNNHLQIPSSLYKYRQKTTTYKICKVMTVFVGGCFLSVFVK